MPRVASFISLGTLALDPSSPITLHRQLYERLRGEIVGGRLPPSTRLPSTRALAHELSVSRNTVCRAYEQLSDEGYIEMVVGSGTRVTSTLPEEMLLVKDTEPSAPYTHETSAFAGRLSAYGEMLLQHTPRSEYYQAPDPPRAFCPALPALDAFPTKLWERLLVESWNSLAGDQLGYQSPLGYAPLREVLTDYLRTARGVRCTPEQIIITSGTQQALSLIASLLLRPGDGVWVENPSFHGMYTTLQGMQAHIYPIEVDGEGLIVEQGIAQAKAARLAYISPSHQYPLGVTMSLTRRLQLLQWAQEQGTWVIEDDYDSEFRYVGHPIEALQGLDQGGRVIYMGTFSKVLFPALRVGYLVVPRPLVKPFQMGRAYLDRCQSVLEQATLTHFITAGHFARHLRKMRMLYSQRQLRFISYATKFLSPWLRVEPERNGLHTVGWLPDGWDDKALSKALLQQGIEAPALSSFSLKPMTASGLVLGFAVVDEIEMIRAFKVMRDVFIAAQDNTAITHQRS